MKTNHPESADSFRPEPPISVGTLFTFENSSCMPVLPTSTPAGDHQPVGFLVAQPAGVSFVAAPRPGHHDPFYERISLEWTRQQEPAEPASAGLPTEYWYG